ERDLRSDLGPDGCAALRHDVRGRSIGPPPRVRLNAAGPSLGRRERRSSVGRSRQRDQFPTMRQEGIYPATRAAGEKRWRGRFLTERRKTLILTISTVCLTLLACEIALRVWDGVSLLNLSDFRRRGDPRFEARETVRYDPVVGWTLRDNFARPDLHTVAFGIRRSSVGQIAPRPGHILAVGSSFTQGFEVADGQTWPAQLERQIGQPVDNAGTPGYGVDQTVPRAEQLVSAMRPRVLLLGLTRQNIEWTARAVNWGRPKPFFTVEDGTLRAHNSPAPRPSADPWEPVKSFAGYSHLIDRA